MRFVSVGFVEHDTWVGSTGIYPRSDPNRIATDEALLDYQAVPLGWSEELTDLPNITVESLRQVRLRSTTACSRYLPAPSWWSGPEPPRLAAAGIVDACLPNLVERLGAEVRCSTKVCFPQLRQTGCSISVDLQPCAFNAQIKADISPKGDACIGQSSECVDADLDGLQAFSCETIAGSCNVELREKRGPLNPAIKRVQLGSAPVLNLNPLPGEWLAGPAAANSRLHDAVLLSDALVVLSSTVTTSLLAPCPKGRFRTLSWIDPETLEITRTSTVPACLAALAADPSGYLLSAELRGDTLVLARRGEEGQLVADAVIPHLDSLVEPSIAGIFVVDQTILIGVRDIGEPSLHFARADLETLEPKQPGPKLSAGDAWVELRGRLLVVADGKDERALFISPETGEEAASSRINQDQLDFGPPLPLPNGRVLIPTLEDESGVYELFGDPRWGRSFEISASPFSLANVDNRIYVGMVTGPGPEMRAILATMDESTMRFEPGYVELGEGVVHELFVRDGTVWALLGFSGEIVKIPAL